MPAEGCAAWVHVSAFRLVTLKSVFCTPVRDIGSPGIHRLKRPWSYREVILPPKHSFLFAAHPGVENFSPFSCCYEQLATIRVMSSACFPRLNCCTSLRILSRISPADWR